MIKIPKDMFPGTIHQTNMNGDIEIIEYRHSSDILVRFVDTGYEVSAKSGSIRLGQVKDRLKITVAGVGFIGKGTKYLASHPAYAVWGAMLKRCYVESTESYRNYGGSGVTVCDEWHDFQVFADWYVKNYPDSDVPHQLDKDKNAKGNTKIYSPETCCFLTCQQNTEVSIAKYYSFISPSGDVVNIHNLNMFCKLNGLSFSSMQSMTKRKCRPHHGWTYNKLDD